MLKLFGTLAALSALTGIVSTKNINNTFINSNQIEISSDEYQKFTNMGYSSIEIDGFTNEKYEKLKNLVLIDSKQFYTESQINPEYINQDSIIENKIISKDLNFTQEDGAFNITSTEYSTSDSSKTMKTTVSKVYDKSIQKILVKQDICWNTVPKDRCEDIVALSYTSNMRLEETNGNPDVEMTFTYNEEKYSKAGWRVGHTNNRYKESTRNISHKEVYNGSNHDKYSHNLGSHIAFKCKLPKDTSTDGSSRRYYLVHRSKYNQFNITLETVLLPNFSDLTGTEIQARYSHQTVEKEINWGEVSFTTTPPFISYNYTGWFWQTHNSFDSGLFSSISLNF